MSTEQNELVVLVDDEEMVLTSLRSILALETEYQIETFTSANLALEFVASNDVDIILSDYLMPEMDGITFLGKVRDLKPEIPRLRQGP
jgi:DNA-binding NtrC family response regulator